MLNPGDKILVAHRRLFERDEARFFVGSVDACEAGIVKVTGHSFVRDMMGGRLIENADARTKILSLSSGTLLFDQLPSSVSLDAVEFVSDEARLLLTDGRFSMNLSEHARVGRM